MPFAPSPRATRAILFTLLISACALRLPDTPDATRRLIRTAPTLDPRFAHHLVHDDEREFLRYCEEVGQEFVRLNYAAIDEVLRRSPANRYREDLRTLSPVLGRIADAVAITYGTNDCRQDLDFRIRLGDRGVELNRQITVLRRLQADVALPLEAKLDRYRVLSAEFEGLGYERGVAAVEGEMAREVMQKGLIGERNRLLASALRRARRLGEHVLVCQYLGEIGFEHRVAGRIDSMHACYREGIEIADRHRIPDQAARLRLFLANYYVASGRLALGADLVRDAQAACRRFGGGPLEIRAVMQAMERFARLGCWDIVRQQSNRLPALLRGLEHSPDGRTALRYSLEARHWQARLLAAEGRPEDAIPIFASLRAPVRRARGREGYGELLAGEADALLAAGRAELALGVVQEGLAFADSFSHPRLAADLALLRVRAAVELGRLEVATDWLREARARADGNPVPSPLAAGVYDALDVRIEHSRGHAQAARRLLVEGYHRHRDQVRGLEPGPQSYLAVSQAQSLREAALLVLANDAAAGYRFELDWRSLPSTFGSGPPVRGPAPRGPVAVGSGDEIHVVYGTTEAGLVRWVAAAGGVRRETLPLPMPECERLVDQAMRWMGSDPGDARAGMPDSLRALCVALGRQLLPPEARNPRTTRVVVSADGALGRLPFEVLDVGSGGEYEPLLARHDVVYARPVSAVRRAESGRGTVVLVESAAPAAGRGAGAEGSPLAAAALEAAAARAALPEPRVVYSNALSKESLLAAWSEASIIYVAAHLVRDRETPLLCYFPMVFGGRPDRREDSYLDLLDVRSTKLAGCRLAVLSSCASGEPYVIAGRSGPSMADVLLDAGAAAVICTRWDIRDDRAASIAPRLASTWANAGRDPVPAWCEARRAMMRGPGGWCHPFDWAAWSVAVAMPVRPWDEPAEGLTASGASARAAHARPTATAVRVESPRRSRERR